MKIALAQMTCVLGDVPANCAQMVALTEQAARRGCDVIVFPEMSDTGYDVSVIEKAASAWDEKPLATLQAAAVKHGLHVVAGLSERDGKRLYNSTAVINPRGELTGKYRKAHLYTCAPVNEDRCFGAGDALAVVDIGGFRCGLMICYDLRFPELARALALKGADVLILTSAWLFPRVAHWNTLLAARAIENQVYVAGCNRVGTDAGTTFCGSSAIIDPYGIVVAAGATDRNELVIGEVSRDTLVWVRGKMPVLRDRRADLY